MLNKENNITSVIPNKFSNLCSRCNPAECGHTFLHLVNDTLDTFYLRLYGGAHTFKKYW